MDRLSFAFSATLDPGKKMPPGNMYAVSPIQLTYDAYGKRDAFGAPLAPVSVKFNVPGGFKTVPRSLWSAYVVLFVPFGGWGKGGGAGRCTISHCLYVQVCCVCLTEWLNSVHFCVMFKGFSKGTRHKTTRLHLSCFLVVIVYVALFIASSDSSSPTQKPSESDLSGKLI